MNDLRWDWTPPVSALQVCDLEALADESSRMGLSLAALIGAMECQSKIAWCEEKSNVKT